MPMQLPSGRELKDSEIPLLRLMVDRGFVRYAENPFRPKSGIESNVYVFGREDLTDNGDLEWEVGKKIAHVVWNENGLSEKKPVLIGLPTAGTALAQAAAMFSSNPITGSSDPMAHRIMREAKKGHGPHSGTWVNGKPDPARHAYWAVDNVATDGATKLEAAPKFAEDGYNTREMNCLIFVDRQQGAVPRLEEAHLFKKVVVVYYLLDLTYAFGEHGLWPKSAVASVEAEIKAHQVPRMAPAIVTSPAPAAP